MNSGDEQFGTDGVWVPERLDNAFRNCKVTTEELTTKFGMEVEGAKVLRLGTVDGGAVTVEINAQGEWVESIPLPYYRTKYCCPEQCERSFWTMRGYRGHYALEHILKLKAN